MSTKEVCEHINLFVNGMRFRFVFKVCYLRVELIDE